MVLDVVWKFFWLWLEGILRLHYAQRIDQVWGLLELFNFIRMFGDWVLDQVRRFDLCLAVDDAEKFIE